MGILGFAAGDTEAMARRDEEIAGELDARMRDVQRTADSAADRA
jgi:hypothetical protein